VKELPVVFKNGKEQIVGVLHLPDNPCGSVIVFHGFLRNKSDKILVDIARDLCSNDFAVLRFDFRGCGDSQGNSENYCPSSEISDISAAVTFLKEKISKGKIGIIGHSHGATIALLFAGGRKDIDAIISIAPTASFRAGWTPEEVRAVMENGFLLYRGHRVGKKMWLDALKYDPVSEVRKVKCPVLFVVGSEDSRSREDTKVLFENANEPKKFHIIPGGDHHFTDPKAKKQ